MSSLTDTQVITASGGLVELGYTTMSGASVAVAGGTNSVIIGPTTVVCDGSPILVEVFFPRVDVPAGGEGYMTAELDGSGTNRVVDNYNPGTQVSANECYGSIRLTPSAGVHTLQIRATSTVGSTTIYGTTIGVAYMRISKIVQATQWPAVTTGTIICTSTTRPATPFVGQEIYESDTARSRYWNGTSWVGRGWEKIGNFTNNSTTLDYTSIPQTYQHLQVRWVAQSNRAGIINTGGRFRWNGLTSNYQIAYSYQAGASIGTSNGGLQAWGFAGQIPAGTRANDNYMAEVIIDFPYYSATNRIRTATAVSHGFDGTNILYCNAGASNDSSIAAITSISLSDDVLATLGPRSSAELWGLWA